MSSVMSDTVTSTQALSQSSSLRLILDTRETRLADALTSLSVPFTVAPLDVGDLLIQDAEGVPLLVAERKSHADFAASNQDGRYREQRARLLAVRGSGVAVLYILEGVWSGVDTKVIGGSRVTESQLKRLTTRLTIRYGLPVLAADSILDTARWCRLLLTQLTEDITVFQPESEAATASAMAGFTSALSIVKKGNKTAGGTATAMMGAVPGLGSKRVAALLAERSIAELAALEVKALATLVVGGRKIGDKLAATIADALRYKPDA
jgi:ERCC4-type nuclease